MIISKKKDAFSMKPTEDILYFEKNFSFIRAYNLIADSLWIKFTVNMKRQIYKVKLRIEAEKFRYMILKSS
jgi:hypothetical protein